MRDNTRTYPILEDVDTAFQKKQQQSFQYEAIPPNQLVSLAVGNMVSQSDLDNLRESITTSLKQYGFPSPLLTNESKQKIDRSIGQILYDKMDITPSVAATLPMWQFINICLLPDVVMWRWGKGKENHDRYISLRRNYCGTQWWRYYLFMNSESLYFSLPESIMSELYERSGTRGLPDHVVEVATWFGMKVGDRFENHRDLFREVIKAYDIELSYRLYFSLSEDDKKELFDSCYTMCEGRRKD